MIVDLQEYKLQQSPHLEGTGVCLQCKHEWAAVAPCGVELMECPKCGLHKAVLKGICVPEEMWECKCGCKFFFICKTGLLCSLCGTMQQFGDY